MLPPNINKSTLALLLIGRVSGLGNNYPRWAGVTKSKPGWVPERLANATRGAQHSFLHVRIHFLIPSKYLMRINVFCNL